MAGTTASNKIKFGLSNAHYAIATVGDDGTITYSTPVKIPGVTKLSLKKDGDDTKIAADDLAAYATIKNNQGYTGTLEMEIVPDTFRTDILGETLNTDGVLIENSNATTHKFALMFEIKGDIQNRRVVFYYCDVERIPFESNTKADKVDADTDTLTIDIKPRSDTGDVKAITTSTATPAIYDGWYTTVYNPTAVNTGA